MATSRHHNVYTPGSVDSWDMENLKFLRKISHGRNPCGESDVETLSYVSDSDSAVFEDRQVYDESDYEKDHRSDHHHQQQHLHHEQHHHEQHHHEQPHHHERHYHHGAGGARIYGSRVDDQSEDDDSQSDYGMSCNGDDNESEIQQSPTRLLDEALYSGGNGFALLNKAIVMKQMKSMAASTLKDPYLEDPVDEEEDIIEPLPMIHTKNFTAAMTGGSGPAGNFDRRLMKTRKPKPSLVTLGFMEPQLEDCYVLDVVTVRNESVLAERGRAGGSHLALSDSQDDSESEGGRMMEKMLKMNGAVGRRNGSAGLPSSSSSSVSSSEEEYNSARDGISINGFFPSPTEDDDPIEIHRDSSPEEGTRAASCSPVSVVVRGECTTRIPIGYPQSSTERSFATASSNYYYLGQQQEDFEQFPQDSGRCSGIDFDIKENRKESLRMVETPRSISPYYVRLRRDLLPPSYTPPHPRQPYNFGMNRQGLLVIDYSPNWDGLETYVRNLSLQS